MKNTLEVKGLKTHFITRRGVVKAVDGVTFSVGEGETLGIVGESGCGKSVTCLSILRLVPAPAGRIVAGEIFIDGENLLLKSPKEMRKVRGAKVSMILQDPMTSLNPVFTIGNQVAEPIKLHQHLDKKTVWEKAKEMLALVKIPLPEVRVMEYPHQMSGGMRQRIVGAMALSCQPKLLIADEPTTALDVTIQAQFLQLLKSIQREFDLSLIVVTHDLGIVAKVCDRVVVMYAGKIVENAPIREIFNSPKHPYTIALMNSLPKMDQNLKRLPSIEGQPPDLGDLPPGCGFAPRCPQVMEICKQEFPSESVLDQGHAMSCWLAA
ncbi:MAG: ABC transporter ATP-binding protein [Desulfobacteraceae bacterium]|nr:ABC transporter ATP-binding protein [Desulfobacteraceae bacterium]